MDKLKKNYNKYIFNKKENYLIAIVSAETDEDKFLNKIAPKISGEFDILQVKNEGMPDLKFLELCKKIKLLCAEFDVTFLVAQRADIAFLTEADGVHLEHNDIDIKSAREILGHNSIIGISVENPQELSEDADYILAEDKIAHAIKNTCDISIFIKGLSIRKLS